MVGSALGSRGSLRLMAAWIRLERRLSVAEKICRRWRKLVGIRQHHADLPELIVIQRIFEGRHSGQANTVGCLPVGLARRIVGDSMALEQLWWLREHSFRNCGGRLVRKAMAH